MFVKSLIEEAHVELKEHIIKRLKELDEQVDECQATDHEYSYVQVLTHVIYELECLLNVS